MSILGKAEREVFSGPLAEQEVSGAVGRVIGAAFLLGTFRWTSKENCLAPQDEYQKEH